MDSALAPILTPHGRITLAEAPDAPHLDPEVAQRLQGAFARGSGHGLLHLGAAEAGTALPPVLAYWREFGARYVTALCSQPDSPIATPDDLDLERLVFAAPPMTGVEYLTRAVLHALWRELDAAFAIELAEAKCGVQEFLKQRNPAWNLVGRVHFNLAENRKDEDAPFAFLATYTTRLSARA
jgi:non-specific serine/threonine protein kinase